MKCFAAASLLLAARHVGAGPTTVEIAPLIEMPLLSCGVSNRTNWVQAGGRGVDTAFSYGDPDQSNAGRVVVDSGHPRSEFFVTTKIPCCPTPFIDWCRPGWDDTSAVMQHDLDVLGLGYADLLILHWPCTTMEATVETYRHMEGFARSGKARAIGVSNFNASFLEAFVAAVTIKPAVNQNGFSIGGHAKEETKWGRDDVTLAKCKELGITYSAYGPLGDTTSVDVLHQPRVLEVAAAHKRSAAQVALRWVVQQGIPSVTSTNSLQHAADDLEVYNFELTAEEMQLLAEVQPDGVTEPARIMV